MGRSHYCGFYRRGKRREGKTGSGLAGGMTNSAVTDVKGFFPIVLYLAWRDQGREAAAQ